MLSQIIDQARHIVVRKRFVQQILLDLFIIRNCWEVQTSAIFIIHQLLLKTSNYAVCAFFVNGLRVVR